MRRPKIDIIDEQWISLPDETDRSPSADGFVHLTRIIRDLDQRDYSGVSWNMDVTRDVGFIYERALEMAWKDKLGVRPGEIEIEGIVGSPDGVGTDPLSCIDLVDEEYKFTWRSSNNPIEQNWYYMTQFKGYCYMIDTNVTVAKVLYGNGDYKGSGPQYIVYRIEFDEKDLLRNWDYLLTHARNKKWVK